MNESLPRPRGRLFFANPGPTNIPDSVMHAMAHASVDWFAPDFLQVYRSCVASLQRLLGTTGDVIFYTGSGHAAWEASLVNLFSPGDLLLYPQTGSFSDGWAKMAQDLGLRTEILACDWRDGIAYEAIEEALTRDRAHAIKALCVVHNETSTGMVLDPARCRAALDAAGHPALLLVDTISSLGIIDFRFADWGVDCVVGGSQKGLMLPTGLSFTGISAKALAAHQHATLPKAYFNWSNMLNRVHRSFIGTVPTTFFYGMQESLRLLLDDEGLEHVFARHARLAGAVRRCVGHWAGNGGPQLFCRNPERVSNSVTTVLMPEGYDPDAVRATALGRFNVSLGGGLAQLNGKVFRIGHLGDLNEPMILGTLAAVEMSLAINKVPHTPGGVAAAMEALTTD
jgi:alanine-glyoxylate transaminase/serine-glyoxylate transaminase/serine-pyruvate transaminase